MTTTTGPDVEPGSGYPLRAAGRRLYSGMPIAAFTTLAAEAASWVEWSELAERKAYMAAIWESLSPADRQSFLAWTRREP